MGLLERIRDRRAPVRSITSVDGYLDALNSFMFQGNTYGFPQVNQTLPGQVSERIPNDLVGYATAAYASNGPVFSCMAVRQLVFSAVRFRWQRSDDGKPSKMFGTADLGLLERPWAGGTTQDLLSKTIQYADLAGNAYSIKVVSYARIDGDRQADIVPLRPDYVDIVLAPRMHPNGGQAGWRRLGYLYTEGGLNSGERPVALLPEEVSHFAPHPDPLAAWRGMSWLTPVIREIRNDKTMLSHQQKFFENAATPNLVVKMDPSVTVENFAKFKAIMDAEHRGFDNAYKTLFLGGGADATVVGANFQQMTFTDLQAASETRIASAAGVPPVVAGFTKGLESATYSNYGQARRRFADGTMHPLWQNAAGSFEPLLSVPPGSSVRLWYDPSNVPFLREDEKDAAEIQSRKAQTIRQLVDAGYKPESVVNAVESGDFRLLEHSGLYSVQLQPAGAQAQPPAGGISE
jgi:phage portal protein BeeE